VLPAGASARNFWVCEVPGEGSVTFVSAAHAALHGITRANEKAGAVFQPISARFATLKVGLRRGLEA
jgi:hypothetical protein